MARLKPVHPGKILRDEFMIRFDWNPNKLALALRVAAPNADEIVREARGISSDMSFRLARYFGTTAEFWMNLQAHYDPSVSRQKAENRINQDVEPFLTTSRTTS
jgi:antitoxin HigA-1